MAAKFKISHDHARRNEKKGQSLVMKCVNEMKFSQYFCDLICLRAIAGNTSRIKIFLILCIQFVLSMDCQFMK